ncbi:hypothetical protein PM082_001066 [Marasmius tenuissimus]|nr:hypothetical protein PM082_001066 [Marasmius tenuissimus]
MSRTSSSTEASSNTPSISPASSSLRVHFDAPTTEIGKRFLQFHVISAGLSEKASGKRPASSFVEMSYGNGKSVYTTSTVNCKTSDPIWHDNLGPVWLKEDAFITFRVRHRTIPMLKASTIASTRAYRVHELIDQQKDLYDLKSTIQLPLEFTSSSPPTSPNETKRTKALGAQTNIKYLTINLRSPSSTESATEEVAKAHARRNSIRHEQQHTPVTTAVLPPATLKSSDTDSGEDLRLAIDRKAALELQGEAKQIETIAIVPTIICTSPN